MNEQKPIRYYRVVVSNSYKDEKRQNANASKHIVPYGQEPLAPTYRARANAIAEAEKRNIYGFDNYLCKQSVDGWLMCINNTRLLEWLQSLYPEAQLYVYRYAEMQYSQRELAELYSVHQTTISRWNRMFMKSLQNFMVNRA